MNDILYFIACIVVGKFIEDNLPNLYYKNIQAFYNKHLLPVLLTAYLGQLYLIASITKSKEYQNQYLKALTMLLLIERKQRKKPLMLCQRLLVCAELKTQHSCPIILVNTVASGGFTVWL